jgi:hypothetical protein
MPTSAAYCSIGPRAWRLVPTKHTSLPSPTVFSMKRFARSRPLIDSRTSRMWIWLRTPWMYGAIFGFQLLRRWPKWMPASMSS